MIEMTKRVLALPMLVLAAAAVLTGCGDDDDSEEVADLTSVVAEPPQGFTQLPDGDGFGPFDREQYLTRFSDEEDIEGDRKEFEDAGMERGIARGWLRADGTVLAQIVFETKSSSAAKDVVKQIVSDGRRENAASTEDSDVDGATGLYYVEQSDEGPQTTHAVVFSRGSRVYFVSATHPELTEGPETVREMAAKVDAVAK